MFTSYSIMAFLHLLGLAFGVGAATVKLRLLFKCKSKLDFVPVFLKVVKPITMIIILGQILLTITGIAWMFFGYTFTPVIIIKIVLLAMLWVLGPVIDNVFQPKFEKSAPSPGDSASPSFIQSQKHLLAAEIIATGLFYVLMILGVLLK